MGIENDLSVGKIGGGGWGEHTLCVQQVLGSFSGIFSKINQGVIKKRIPLVFTSKCFQKLQEKNCVPCSHVMSLTGFCK